MRDIPFQRSIYPASADFAHRWMKHRSLCVAGYGFGGPRACSGASSWERFAWRWSWSQHPCGGCAREHCALGGEPEASLTEFSKQLTNPISSLWSIAFQQNNYFT
jgi:hypothetical protein